MAKSFVSLVCLALVGQALSAPASPLPNKYYGAYESQPELDQNFAEFASVFELPSQISWSRPNVFAIYPEGEFHVARLYFGPTVEPFKLRFKLGETQTVTINGRTVEYVYNVEQGAEYPVLKAKFRDTESDLKFTTDAHFTPTGVNATYVREGVTARRFYTRIPNPAIGGLYENVPEKQSPNFLEFANRVFPAPQGLSWDANTGLWLGRWGRDFVVKYLVTPSVAIPFPFRLNEQRYVYLNGRNISYTYRLVEENWAERTTTFHVEFTTETGKLTLDAVISPEGVSATYKAGEETANRYYRRVLNGQVYGEFVNVPEASVNWAEFAKATGKDDDSTQKTQVQLYRQGEQFYFRYVYESGKTLVYPFTLNKTIETTGPNGKPFKYTFNQKPSWNNDAIFGLNYEHDGKTFTGDWTFNTTGVFAVYRSGAIQATRFYRRVLPTVALGKFVSTPDTPEFTAFTQTIGQPELTKKTTVEITQTPEYTYNQQIWLEGTPEPASFPFVFGQPTNITLKGKNLTYTYYYFAYPVPVLHTYWTEANHGTTTFTVSAEFTPTGYTATYQAGGKLATRTYTRVGAPVPLPTYPTA
jgi:hypothetical protein